MQTLPYQNEQQLAYFESKCNEYFRYYHGSSDNYPEIEVYVSDERHLKGLVTICRAALVGNGFVAEKDITVSTRQDEYNEIVFTFDLTHFSYGVIANAIGIIRKTLQHVARKKYVLR